MILSFIIGVLIFNFLLEVVLEYINGKKWSNKLPAELSGIYDQEKYKLSQEYDRAKKRYFPAQWDPKLGIHVT